jgi:hypothetical protein
VIKWGRCGKQIDEEGGAAHHLKLLRSYNRSALSYSPSLRHILYVSGAIILMPRFILCLLTMAFLSLCLLLQSSPLALAESLACDEKILDRLGQCFRDGYNLAKETELDEKIKTAKGYMQNGGLSARVDWGNLSPSIGDAFTINVTIKNNTNFQAAINQNDAMISFPCEIFGGREHCDTINLSPVASGKINKIILTPQGEVAFSAYFEPAGKDKGRLSFFETITHPSLFQSKNRYPITISFKGSIDKKSISSNSDAIKNSKEDEGFDTVIKNDVNISLSHGVVSFYAALGALIAGMIHVTTRATVISHDRFKLLSFRR